jgi:amino acid transporter
LYLCGQGWCCSTRGAQTRPLHNWFHADGPRAQSVATLRLLWLAVQVRGVFNGAALVFFSFIGFDAVACSAEEVRPEVGAGGGGGGW